MLGVNWPSIADLQSYLTAENTVEDNHLITFRDYHQAFKKECGAIAEYLAPLFPVGGIL